LPLLAHSKPIVIIHLDIAYDKPIIAYKKSFILKIII